MPEIVLMLQDIDLDAGFIGSSVKRQDKLSTPKTTVKSALKVISIKLFYYYMKHLRNKMLS